MLAGAGFVIANDPSADAFGVTVTTYVLAAWLDGVLGGSVAPLQAVKEHASGIASANNSSATMRFRRNANGSPIRKAQNTGVPELHGIDGVRLEALWLAAMVTVEVPEPPDVNVTAVAVAVKSAGVPSVDVTVVVNETVPA